MKPFKETFPGLIIKDNELNNIAALLNVERVALCSRQQMLKICVHAETWVHKKHIYALEKLLKSQLFADTPLSVYIEEHFTLSALYTAQTLMDQYRKSIETELKKENRIMYQVFRSGELSFPEEDRSRGRRKGKGIQRRVLEGTVCPLCGKGKRLNAISR